MKKATLLTFLFAVLMIALLVSCNTSPDPLPDETTTGDVTLEITPEPTDVTSDEAEVSDPVETTTEAVTTRKEYETSRYGSMDHEFYVFMEPIVTEYWSDEKSDEPVQIVDTEVPWVITEWETVEEIKPRKEKTIPEEKSNLAVRAPKTYEFTDNDVSIKAEFSQEYYPIFSPMTVRWTITNLNPDKNLFFRIDHLSRLYNPKTSAGHGVIFSLFPISSDDVPYWYWQNTYNGSSLGENSSIGIWSSSQAESADQTTLTLEFVYMLSPDLFDAEGETDINFNINIRTSSGRHHGTIPLEIVEVEYIEP